MKSSLIRSGAAALVAALAFAACAGNATVPSSGLPITSDSIRAAAPNAGVPCPLPVGWVFGGPCDTVPLKKTGGSGSLPNYMGFTLSSTLFSNNAKKGTALVFEDATGKGDITGKVNGKPFPKLKNALLYLAALNTSAAFIFNATPQITIKSKSKIPGKVCTLNQLAPKSKNSKVLIWSPTPIIGAPKGKTVVFGSAQPPNGQPIPAGAFFLGFTCQ
jgi:hypothetical protein